MRVIRDFLYCVKVVYICTREYDIFSGESYYVNTKEKTAQMHTQNLAPVLYIQSDCDTASNRDRYVVELMKHIRIDSYGACLNNAQLDDRCVALHKIVRTYCACVCVRDYYRCVKYMFRLKDNYLQILSNREFLSFVAKYKFTVAFENAVCDDYITEKLWRPLIVGSVPIYYGSPSFKVTFCTKILGFLFVSQVPTCILCRSCGLI